MEEGNTDGSTTKDNLVSSHKGSARITGPSKPESRTPGNAYGNVLHQAPKNSNVDAAHRFKKAEESLRTVIEREELGLEYYDLHLPEEFVALSNII
ncbi:hypothetical protein CR513_60815, partial [Mucuna pruriens]